MPASRDRCRPGASSMLTPQPESLVTGGTSRSSSASSRARREDESSGGGEQEVYLSGRVPKSLRDELHHQAIHEGRKVVDLLRDALRQYLDTHSR